MADADLSNVLMELDSPEEQEEHPCDICHVSYTSDTELRDHQWSLMHHIKMEKQKKGSVHNCTLCFMTCANIIEYGKHLNEEKHKRAMEDSRRQREEEDLLMGKDVLMARIREKEEREERKYQAKRNNIQGNKNGDNNLSDPETSKRNRVGKRQSERLRKQSRGKGHQRSFSLPGRNPGQNQRNQRWERQSHNNDFTVDPTGNNFMDPSWDQWGGGYGGHQNQWGGGYGGHQNQWTVERGFPMVSSGYGDNSQNQDVYQRNYDNGPYDRHGRYENDRWTIDRKGKRENTDPPNNGNQNQNEFYSDPNSPYELQNSSGIPERTWKWGEPSHRQRDSHSGDGYHNNYTEDRYHGNYSGERYQDDFSRRGRRPSRWSRNNNIRDSTRRDNYNEADFKNPNSLPQNSHKPSKGQSKDNSITNSKHDKHDKPSTSQIDARSDVIEEPRSVKNPTSEKYQESTRETRNRSESSEKVSNKRRRFNSPSRSLERSSRHDREPRNTHIRFADEEKKTSVQCTDEADSTTSSGDREDLSSGSSGRRGSAGSREKKKGILKKKKKNVGKGSPPGSPKRSSKKGRDDKGGEGVLEKAEKLCRELREKREKAKLERERKMKIEQQEKLENINQELKTLSDKSMEYVKGHIPTEEKKQPGVSSVTEGKETAQSNITMLGQSNKEIEKIRQNIEKSVQSVSEIQRLQSSSGSEGNSGKRDLNGITSKSESVNSEKSGKQTGKRETSTNKLSGVETKKMGAREETSGASAKKSKEKPNTEALLKMVNSPRSRKERKQLAEMLRSYAQTQKKLSLPRYNLQLSGSYDDKLDERIEELRLEELSPEVQIQIAQLMEAEATPNLNDLEKALMTSSGHGKNQVGSSLKDDTIMVSSPVEKYLRRDKALQGSSNVKLRTLSADSDQSRPLVRRMEDVEATPPLQMSDLQRPLIPKSEPIDLEYEKAAQKSSTSPEIATSQVTSTTNLGEASKTVPWHGASVPRMPLFSDQLPQRSSPQMPVSAALPSLSGSLSSLESGRSTESLFDTVYDISVKEEALRKNLTEVNQFIQYFRNVIEEATIQLNRHNEKKLRLQSEEEKLRSQRLRLLHEAKLQQRSGQSTPQLSEVEDHPRGTAQEDPGKVMTSGHTTTTTPQAQVSPFNDPHTSTLLNVLNRNQRLEPERDRQGFGSSFGTANSSVQANLNSPASDSILAQLRNLSSSLQQETISMETENKLDSSLLMGLGSIKKEPEEEISCFVSSTQGSRISNSIQDAEKSLHPSEDRTKIGAARTSIDDVQGTRINTETGSSRNVIDNHSLPPKPARSIKTPVNKKPETSDLKHNTDVNHSTELKDAGFITLNSLIKTSNLTEDIDSDDEPLANVMRRHRRDSQRSEDSQKRVDSDDSAGEGKKFNMRYMGTLGVDSKAFLTQLGQCQGDNKSQGPSYMVLNKENDAYRQIQSLIKGGRNDKETPVSASRAVEDRTAEGGTRSLRGGHVSDSNYESVNSNCSLGEQIKQHASINKKGTKKAEKTVVIVNSDSDSDRSDRTLQEDPALLSDSCTPVRMVKSCSNGLQNLNLDSSPQLSTNTHIRHGREEEKAVQSADEGRSLSPFRKKLRTKKERDRASARKQKEGFVLDSSSDGGNSVDGDSVPKITEIKQQLVFKSLSNIPAALRAEGLDSEELGLVETGSEDMEQVIVIKEEVEPADSQRRLLEDAQLESESEDNRQLAEEARQRLSLDREVMENFRKAVENMKSTLGLPTLQVPEDLPLTLVRDPVQFQGPKEIISGLEVLNGFIYVSYQSMIINRFSLQTGVLDYEFNTKSHNVNCILVSRSTERLYVGSCEMMLLSYCCKTKRLLKAEPTEGKPQCFHENWGHLYMGTDCGTVVVISLKSDKVLDTFHCADRSISRICSATEGVRRVILVASFDAIIYVYDSSTGLLIRMLEGHTKTPFSLQVDGHLVYSGSGDKTVMEHNISTGELMWTYTEAAGIVSCVCTHGDLLFCASYDRIIRCYNKTSRKLLRLYYGAGKEDGLIIRMTISDGMLITGNRQGLVEAVPISQEDHPCQCGDCNYVFALGSHLVHHVVHTHSWLSGKKTACPWRNCRDKFKSTATKQELEKHVNGHIHS